MGSVRKVVVKGPWEHISSKEDNQTGNLNYGQLGDSYSYDRYHSCYDRDNDYQLDDSHFTLTMNISHIYIYI